MRGSAYRTTRRPSYSRTTTAWSTVPANSSCGGPIGGPGGVPGVAEATTVGPGRAHTARARRSSSASSARSPRAGQVEKPVREDVCQSVGATRTSLPGSRACSAAAFRAYGGAAAPSAPQPPPGSASSAPHTARAAAAASPARTNRRRRSRSVGRAWSTHGSNSGEANRASLAGSPDSATAAAGFATPASVSTRSTSGSGSRSRARRTQAARPGPSRVASHWSRASSSAPPERGNSRSPHTWGSSGGSCARRGSARKVSGIPASRAARSTRSRTYAYPDSAPGVPRWPGTPPCTAAAAVSAPAPRRPRGRARWASEWAVSTRRLRPRAGGSTR